MKTDYLFIKLLLFTLIGFGQTTSLLATPPIDGTWVLYTFNGERFTQGETAPKHPILMVDTTTGRIAGNDGCNNFNGAVEVNEDTIEIGLLASTMMACQSEFPDRFAKALGAVMSYRIEGEHLIVKTREGSMRFTREASFLASTLARPHGYWILQSAMGESWESDRANTPFIRFELDTQTLTGFSGCNTFEATINKISAFSIDLERPLALTRKACPDTREVDLFDAIEKARSFSINGNTLTLFLQGGGTLDFRDESAQVGGDSPRPANMPYPEDADLRLNDIWALVAVFGNPFEPSRENHQHPMIEFHLRDMRAMGNTGCNQFSASFLTSENQLKIDPGAMTRRMCPGDLETNFLRALRETTSFTIANLRLNLMNAEGETVMVFRKVD